MPAFLALAIVLAQLHVDWPTHGFTLANTRHAPLTQITPRNVSRLVKVWRFATGVRGSMETTPIVVGSTMYVTTGRGNNVIALDAATGKQKWRYAPTIGTVAVCCGLINRGVAVAHGRVFLATLDARLIALSAASGKPLWDVRIGRASDGLSETMAPLVWNGMVYIGSAGGEFGIRGSFSAYRASDGKLLWRWYTVGPGWEGAYTPSEHGFSLHRDISREKRDAARYRDSWIHGGGPIWMTPAIDAKSGTMYLSTGNPAPALNGSMRPGDNLYTDSIVALDARTGKMRWYYQQTPHDVWDYDAASPPLLCEALDVARTRVPAVCEAGKTGWLYILDRRDGKLIRLSESIVPNAHIYADQSKEGAVQQPGAYGGVIAPLSYDPARRFVFVAALDRPEYRDLSRQIAAWSANDNRWQGGTTSPVGHWRDFIAAIDVDTGEIRWRKSIAAGPIGRLGARVAGGTLSAGDLVFSADPAGLLAAYDAATGETKWQYQLGLDEQSSLWVRFLGWLRDVKHALFHERPVRTDSARVDASPIAYAVNGREYIALAADLLPGSPLGTSSITAFALPQP